MRHFIFILSMLGILAFSQVADAAFGRNVEVTKEYIVDECGCVVGKTVTRVVTVARVRPLRSLCECVEGTVECITRPLRRCCCERTKTVVVTKGCCGTRQVARRNIWRACDCDKK